MSVAPRPAESTVRSDGLAARPAWQALERHHRAVRHLHLRDLFAGDPRRGERLTAEAAGIYLDYSKNRMTAHTGRDPGEAYRELARELGEHHLRSIVEQAQTIVGAAFAAAGPR